MDDHHRQLIILNNTMYQHKTLRINYTTYDNRRDQDTINPKRQSDIMVLADKDPTHPYWYARVVDIFHAMVRINGPETRIREFQRMEFLWVQWYGIDMGVKSGFAAKRMFQVSFFEGSDAFGFVNPADVLRVIHLIPRFAGPRITDLLGQSIARREDELDQDYERYYVNM